MKKLLLPLIVLFYMSCATAQDLILPVVEVYDGDTIKTKLALPEPLDRISIRLRGLDTPEMPAKSYAKTGKLGRAKCVKEAMLALEAKSFVVDIVSSSTGNMIVTNYKWGKYGSRIVGDVHFDISNQRINLVEELLARGYAVQYYGGTKTKNWCE